MILLIFVILFSVIVTEIFRINPVWDTVSFSGKHSCGLHNIFIIPSKWIMKENGFPLYKLYLSKPSIETGRKPTRKSRQTR